MNMDTNSPTAEIKATVTLETTVDSDWIEFVTGGPEGMCDVFLQGYCGYWATGFAHDAALGWLAYLPDEVEAPTRRGVHEHVNENRATIEAAWRAGQELPKGFHRFDLELAKASWVHGYQKGGTTWYEDGDGTTYDCAVQRGLFKGEVVYG